MLSISPYIVDEVGHRGLAPGVTICKDRGESLQQALRSRCHLKEFRPLLGTHVYHVHRTVFSHCQVNSEVKGVSCQSILHVADSQ